MTVSRTKYPMKHAHGFAVFYFLLWWLYHNSWWNHLFLFILYNPIFQCYFTGTGVTYDCPGTVTSDVTIMMTSWNGNIFRVTGPLCGEFTGHKGQWRGALMFSVICVWINGWENNREAGDLRRYRAHYDVIVMMEDMDPIDWYLATTTHVITRVSCAQYSRRDGCLIEFQKAWKGNVM